MCFDSNWRKSFYSLVDKMSDRSAILLIMTAEQGMIVKTIVGILGGLLISTGYLPSESKDVFTVDSTTAAGYIITIISTVYLLEHALLKVKDDLQYTDEDETPASPTTVTQNTTVEAPAQPTS